MSTENILLKVKMMTALSMKKQKEVFSRNRAVLFSFHWEAGPKCQSGIFRAIYYLGNSGAYKQRNQLSCPTVP